MGRRLPWEMASRMTGFVKGSKLMQRSNSMNNGGGG
jgi:hypothetical protein